jgi:hypothetical protein
MKRRFFFRNVNAGWLILFPVLWACVDPIKFEIPLTPSQIIVEGMISDGPGPYTVKISRALSLSTDSVARSPVPNAKVKLYDDEGNVENLIEADSGIYLTGGLIRGRAGHAYHIQLETPEGNIFKSEPDSIQPVGQVQDIRYEYEARTTEKSFGNVSADVFNIFIDSYAGDKAEKYIRWRYTGTYKVITNPEQHWIWALGFPLKDPYPCSGFVVEPSAPGGGGSLVQKTECTCCTCWVNVYEEKPQLADGELIVNNQFKNVKIAEAPISSATFTEKFMVTVEQMSLSRRAYDFFKLIRVQKEGATSLFQPPSGEIKGNITAVNSSQSVIGLFYATSITSKTVFIERSAIPYLLTPTPLIMFPCTFYPNSSITKPPQWQ